MDASTILFVDNTLYQFVPAIKQVDKWVYKDPATARKRFNLLMLGFGLSSQEVMTNYGVQLAPGSLDPALVLSGEGDDDPAATSNDGQPPAPGSTDAIALIFRPHDPEIARTYDNIQVDFDPKTLLPRRVRLSKMVGEVTTITIDPEKVRLDEPIEPAKFLPDFPGNPEVIEYDE